MKKRLVSLPDFRGIIVEGRERSGIPWREIDPKLYISEEEAKAVHPTAKFRGK